MIQPKECPDCGTTGLTYTTNYFSTGRWKVRFLCGHFFEGTQTEDDVLQKSLGRTAFEAYVEIMGRWHELDCWDILNRGQRDWWDRYAAALDAAIERLKGGGA